MQYDYLKILLDNGFQLPENASEYDDRCMIETFDKREEELIIIIRTAFHGFIYRGKTENGLLFETSKKKKYLVSLTKETIECHLMDTPQKQKLKNRRDFRIYRNENGEYIYKRIESANNNSLLLNTTIIPAPSTYESCYCVIDGYDEDTYQLFLSSIKDLPSAQNCVDVFERFIDNTQILPDISRKVSACTVNYATSVKEELADSAYRSMYIKSIEVDTHYRSLYPILESYVRARDFHSEIIKSRGLTHSYEDEIKFKLTKYKTK